MRSSRATARKIPAPAGTHTNTTNQFGRPVSRNGLTVFTRQLAVLLHAGMPLLRALEVLAQQEQRPAFRVVIEDLAGGIRSGKTLSDGLRQHPAVFDDLYVNMTRAGEAAGALDGVLGRLATFLEKAESIKGRVKAAMTYPVIVMIVAVLILAALMTFVVPRFELIFRDLLKGAPLPLLTRVVLAASNLVKGHAFIALVLFTVPVMAFLLFRRTPRGAWTCDWLKIHAPPVGDLYLKAGVARFTRTFGTLLASGVPILEALLITRDTSGNLLLAGAIGTVHDRVRQGEGVARPLAATRIFPPMVSSMIQVGEETGALPEMLGRVADIYDEEVDNAVQALTSLIEPLMIVFLAVVVGTMVIALFLPIIGIIQHLGG